MDALDQFTGELSPIAIHYWNATDALAGAEDDFGPQSES